MVSNWSRLLLQALAIHLRSGPRDEGRRRLIIRSSLELMFVLRVPRDLDRLLWMHC